MHDAHLVSNYYLPHPPLPLHAVSHLCYSVDQGQHDRERAREAMRPAPDAPRVASAFRFAYLLKLQFRHEVNLSPLPHLPQNVHNDSL